MFKLFSSKQKPTQDHAIQSGENHDEKGDINPNNTSQASEKIKESHGSNGVCCGSCGGQ
jgi:CCGSCS motif protein